MSRTNRRFSRLAAPTVGALLALLSATPGQAAAQQGASEWLQRCRESTRPDRAVHCDLRELTLPARQALDVSAHPNGGIEVRAWDQNQIRLVAKIQAQAETGVSARALASAIRIETENGTVRATGPERRGSRQSWSVSYELSVPRQMDLTLATMNGGLSVDGVRGRLALTTVNGGLSLQGVGGNVRGQTTNGGLDVRLAGDRWNGEGLELRTTNGAISLTLSERYSAHLVASTVNGGLSSAIPITVQGRIGKRIEADLGGGGPPLRLSTTNGPIRIERN